MLPTNLKDIVTNLKMFAKNIKMFFFFHCVMNANMLFYDCRIVISDYIKCCY